MKPLWALLLLSFNGACHAGEIRRGAILQVKPNAILFQDSATLTQWQMLRNAGHAAGLASYQESLLHNRDAWQFTRPLKVKVRGYRPEAKQVDVEMLDAGRMQGTAWVLDAEAVGK